MIIDIVIFCLLGVALVVGLFRNPFKCLVDLVLFVIFTFAFYFLLVKFGNNILSLFNIDAQGLIANLSATLSDTIKNLNITFNEIGSSNGVTLVGIDSLFENGVFYTAFGNSLINLCYFVVATLLADIFAEGIGWAIYGIFRNKVKDMKKTPKRLFGMLTNFVLVAVSLTLSFAPVTTLTNTVSKAISYKDNEGLKNAYTELDGLETRLKGLKTYQEQVASIKTDVDTYSPKVDALSEKNTTVYAHYTTVGNRINVLDAKTLSVYDRARLEQIKTIYSSYSSEIEEGEATLNETVETFTTIKSAVYAANDSFSQLDEGIASIESIKTQFSTITEQLASYAEYEKYCPKIFSFLGNLGFGYGSFTVTYTNEDNQETTLSTSINESVKLLFNNLDSLIENDIPVAISSISTTIDGYYEQAEAFETEYKKYEDQYNDFKENFDSYYTSADASLTEADSALDEADTVLSDIEKNYN